MNLSSVYSERSSLSSKRRSAGTNSAAASALAQAIKRSGNVFVGTYLERRYVHSIQAYRDIVVIEKDEEELIKCLETIQQTAHEDYGSDKWLGITCETRDDETKCYNLWVELESIPLGTHWFQLRSIQVKDGTIQLQLKYLRACPTNEWKSSQALNNFPIDYKEIFTLENTQSALRFTAVLVMSLLGGLCNALWYMGDYSLKFTHELTGLIHAMTPIMFGVIDFFSKCISGLFWLIYVLLRGQSMPVVRPQPQQQWYIAPNVRRPAIVLPRKYY